MQPSAGDQAIRKRLLVINPNTNNLVTQRIREVSEQSVFAATDVVVVSPQSGPAAIESADDRAAAVPQVVSLMTRRAGGFDGYVLACFDDIGIPEARRMVDVPVVGTVEAGIAAARTLACRFAIVTTVRSALPTIEGLIDRYGARGICTVRAAGIGVAAAADGSVEDDAKLMVAIRLALDEDGAEAILLGSGGLAGRAPALAEAFSCPVIDGIAAAVKLTEGLAWLGLGARGRPLV